VTVSSKLFNESLFDPSFVFEIFLTSCDIALVSIPNLSIGIGNKLINSHIFYYKNNVPSTYTTCGPIIYELVDGDTAYLSYSSLEFTLFPKSTAYQNTYPHTLRVKPTNY
jgi:hypothetical protein